jgi:hypothetical protein
MDPDPGSPKTYGSYGSGFGSATLVKIGKKSSTFSMTPGMGASASPTPLPPRDSERNFGTGRLNSRLPPLHRH